MKTTKQDTPYKAYYTCQHDIISLENNWEIPLSGESDRLSKTNFRFK